ncbi:sensor histidine kinase [Actinomadura viridis]|uniref:sensor histidine kinase n=1 Tax=Actinomadura viridis TaxID=58110 RepID=UPI0036BFA835
MAVHAGRSRGERAALERALLVWVVATIVVGCGWLVALSAAGEHTRTLVAAGGGAAALVITLAIASTAYFAEYARRLRGRLATLESDGDRLEHRLRETVAGPLPEMIGRLREGAAPQAALENVPARRDPVLGPLLRTVAEGVAAGEHRAARAAADRAELEAEAARLADTTVPTLVKRIREDRASVPTVLAEVPAPAQQPLEALLRRIAEDLAAGERTSAAARAACASAAARIQAQTTRMLAQLRELQHRYGDDEVFGDLLDLDHHLSQMGRLADSIALLSGGRSGRRWTKPIVMESILRGAMGRIAAYQRVQYHSTSTAAVAGFAAEGVMHALAELMDNAANFSPHGTVVHVYVEEEDAGVVVTIEDSGLGMRQRERQRAERLVSEAADLTSLPGTRLGLAVVGRLARKHALTVSFRPSARGGTGAVVLIPRQLITHSSDGFTGKGASAPTSGEQRLSGRGGARGDRTAARAGAGVHAASGPVPSRPVETDPGDDGDDLPKRRRGATLASAPAGPAPRPAARTGNAGARFAAFRQSAAVRRDPAGATGPLPTGSLPTGSVPASSTPPGSPPADSGDAASAASAAPDVLPKPGDEDGSGGGSGGAGR